MSGHVRARASHRVAFPATAEALYARIAAAMPRWLSKASRDDAIGDLFLAVLESRVQFADIEQAAQRFASRTTRDYENRFGPISIDAVRFDDSDRTLADFIPDPSALAAFDHIFEGAIS